MLDGLRGHDVEQHIAQHAAADSREHSSVAIPNRSKPFRTPTVAPDEANTAMPA